MWYCKDQIYQLMGCMSLILTDVILSTRIYLHGFCPVYIYNASYEKNSIRDCIK